MKLFDHLIRKYNITEGNIAHALEYLKYYGYLSKENDISKAVQLFQKFANITIDGEIGPQTLGNMTVKRCGVADFDVESLNYRRSMSKWNKKKLVYYIKGWLGGTISRLQQRAIIRQAWYNWERVCDIHLYETFSASQANIIIDIGSGPTQHFDGPGGTLAWAYLPRGNDKQLLMRFDAQEKWAKTNSKAGVLLLNVAAHEFGHLLGLDHSDRKGALMAPFYNPRIFKPQSADDVTRIQMRYGKPSNKIEKNRFYIL